MKRKNSGKPCRKQKNDEQVANRHFIGVGRRACTFSGRYGGMVALARRLDALGLVANGRLPGNGLFARRLVATSHATTAEPEFRESGARNHSRPTSVGTRSSARRRSQGN